MKETSNIEHRTLNAEGLNALLAAIIEQAVIDWRDFLAQGKLHLLAADVQEKEIRNLKWFLGSEWFDRLLAVCGLNVSAVRRAIGFPLCLSGEK